MTNQILIRQLKSTILFVFALNFFITSVYAQDVKKAKETEGVNEPIAKISGAKKVNPSTVEIIYENGQKLIVDFYGDNIFRLFQDNTGGVLRDPQAKPEARILVDNPRKPVSNLSITDENNSVLISTEKVSIEIGKNTSLLKVFNKKTKALTLQMLKPLAIEKNKLTITLKENPDEYFYGGGVQNGRFSHKGKAIAIENQNSWTDGGVASPNPFYWSDKGYGIMFYTFKKGKYDFGAKEAGVVKLSHETSYLDAFIMINDGAVSLLNDFYQLTGNPVLLPKFGFYQGHLNAYNRDFWKEDEKGFI